MATPKKNFHKAKDAEPRAAAPKKATKKAAAPSHARTPDEMLEQLGNPKDIDLTSDNVTKIGRAANARGKDQETGEVIDVSDDDAED